MSVRQKKTPAGRKDLGAWYTQPELCRFLVAQALAPILQRRPETVPRLTICDPTAGAGAFLRAALEYLDEQYEVVRGARGRHRRDVVSSRAAWRRHTQRHMLYGVDVDAAAVRRARREIGIPASHLRQGNVLLPQRQPFSWKDSFPDVFRLPRRGFDVILSNPPWNNLRPDDREFFEQFEPGFRQLRSRTKRDRRKSELLRRRDVAQRYEKYAEKFAKWNAFVRESGFYEHQGPPAGFRSYKIEHNLYKLAMEVAWKLAAPDGVVGLVVPAGFLGDLGATQLRRLYFDGGACRGLWSFREDAGLFDAAQAFAVIIFEKGAAPRPFTYRTGLRNLAELEEPAPRAGPRLTVGLIRRTAAAAYAVPELHGPLDLAILRKLYGRPPLSDLSPKHPWQARPARDLHTRDDRDLFREYDTGVPLLKGDGIEAFAIRRPIRRWVDPAGYAERGKDFHASRVAWRAIANVNLPRRLCATLVPPGYGLLNSLNYFVPEQTEEVKLYLLALLNSFVLEWRIRQLAKNNNINQYVIASLPVPRLTGGDARFDRIEWLVRRVLASQGKDEGLRAELEARVAKLYELTAEELAAVLGRFPRVAADIRSRVLRCFRSQARPPGDRAGADS